MSETQQAPQLALTDDGLEAPEELVGRTGTIRVEKPDISMEMQYVGDGVSEYDEHLTVFPATEKTDNPSIPEKHVRIQGRLYEIVDERTVNECPECGSDKVSACDNPVKCYDCDTELGELL